MPKIKIADLQTAETATLHLKDAHGKPMYFTPDGEGTERLPVIATIYGPGSEVHRQAELQARRRVMDLVRQGGDAGSKARELTPEERDADTAELMADITASIDGIDTEDRPMREVLRELFADRRCGYITDQINSFGGDWANFYKGAAHA